MIYSAHAVGSTALATGRVERKLAAILAADVAGYSRLMGADEEGTLAALKTLRRELADPKIKEHRGRIVKTTGDGLLVEFSSVVDALRCATEVQRAMVERNVGVPTDKRIKFRIGIHQGDVVVEEGDIFGDGVNIAARLEALAEPGGICVSARVQEDAAGKLDIAFEDLGDQALKNIMRPIRAYRIAAGPVPASVQGRPTLALPDTPSVAVLPFSNMSGDPDQEFFADGIAEDIITALSRFPSLFVIARNSSFIYKGRAVDVKQVGRELGVRYVLEGSLRKAGNRIRVTAQLVEAETGRHVWAGRYDRDLVDIFALQDEITEAVTIAVAPAIADAERQRAMRRPPQSLDAWAAYQRGLWHSEKYTAEDNRIAEHFFQQAIELDPTFAGGYNGLAITRIAAATRFATIDLVEGARSAEELARRALALDPSNAGGCTCLSWALLLRGDFEGALSEAQRALVLSPSLAGAHSTMGAVLIFSGRLKEGLAEEQTALRLDPRSPTRADHLLRIAAGRYFCRAYEDAVEAAKQAIRSQPNSPLPYRFLAAALGQLGRTEEAAEALQRHVAIAPAALESFVRHGLPFFRSEEHAHLVDGLRKAGLPEQ